MAWVTCQLTAKFCLYLLQTPQAHLYCPERKLRHRTGLRSEEELLEEIIIWLRFSKAWLGLWMAEKWA